MASLLDHAITRTRVGRHGSTTRGRETVLHQRNRLCREGPCQAGEGHTGRMRGQKGNARRFGGAGGRDKVDKGKGACSDRQGMLWRKPRLPSMVRVPFVRFGGRDVCPHVKGQSLCIRPASPAYPETKQLPTTNSSASYPAPLCAGRCFLTSSPGPLSSRRPESYATRG